MMMDNYREQIEEALADQTWPSLESVIARPAQDRVPAAVLVGIIEADEPRILLTRRADHLTSHAGQVAFPGGRWEREDDSFAITALREANEEVGLDPAHVELSGALEIHHTGYGQVIVPIIGFVDAAADFSADDGEVAEIFSVPLRFLMTPENYQPRERTWQGQVWNYQVVSWEGREIWGATASILHSFYQTVFAKIKGEV